MKPLFNVLKKVDSGVVGLTEAVAAFGIVAATLIIVVNVIMRYFFANSIFWAEEAVRYIIIWTSYLGFSHAIRYNMHIKVDTLHHYLPPKAKKALIMAIYFACFVCCALFAYYAWVLIGRMQTFGQVNAVITWLPMWIVNLCLPIFGILGTKDYLQLLILNFRKKGEIVTTVGGGIG